MAFNRNPGAFTAPPINDNTTTAPKADKPGFRIISVMDAINLPPPRWIVRDLLVEQSLCVLYGPPASLKSFLAIDIAMAMAHGRKWHGKDCPAGWVVYVAAEGAAGLGKRCHGWCLHNRADPRKTRMAIIPQPVPLVDADQVGELIAYLKEWEATSGKIALIILDTLARCMAGQDENGPQAMSLAVDGADRVKRELSCTTILIHHSGKDTTRGPRGHNSLVGAADTMIRIERDENRLSALIQKQKDAEDGFEYVFSTEIVPLPEHDGVPQSTIVLKLGTPIDHAAESRLAADRQSIASMMMGREPMSLSSLIAAMAWPRGASSYDRIREAVAAYPATTMVAHRDGVVCLSLHSCLVRGKNTEQVVAELVCDLVCGRD